MGEATGHQGSMYNITLKLTAQGIDRWFDEYWICFEMAFWGRQLSLALSRLCLCTVSDLNGVRSQGQDSRAFFDTERTKALAVEELTVLVAKEGGEEEPAIASTLDEVVMGSLPPAARRHRDFDLSLR